MYLKPKDGLNVPDPARGDYLPAEGRQVEPTQYWQRRLNDGDVTEASAPVATPLSKKES
jgi:hypothetical protein